MIVIRKGQSKDLNKLFGLIKELAEFEKALDKVTNTVERMEKEKTFFDFFVAESDGKIVGGAVYFFAYFTWVGKSLYLDDLYVKPTYRGQKIGVNLLQKILQVAKTKNCQRVRWQVLDWNTPAIEFYQKVGVSTDNTWLNCDLSKADAMQILRKMNF